MKQKLVIAIAIILVGAGYAAYDVYVVFLGEEMPVLDSQYQKLEADLGSKKNELKQLQEFSKNIEAVQKDLKELQAKLDSALEYMPRTFKLEVLLRKLTLLAANSGVEMTSFRPKKGEEKSGSFYSTIAIDFDLRGGFTQTLVFLDQLTRLKRIVNIESLKIRPLDANAAGRSGNILLATQASIKTFRFSE